MSYPHLTILTITSSCDLIHLFVSTPPPSYSTLLHHHHHHHHHHNHHHHDHHHHHHHPANNTSSTPLNTSSTPHPLEPTHTLITPNSGEPNREAPTLPPYAGHRIRRSGELPQGAPGTIPKDPSQSIQPRSIQPQSVQPRRVESLNARRRRRRRRGS